MPARQDTLDIHVDDRVEAYLVKHSVWRGQLELARAVIVSTELEETMKWGGPAYTLDARVLLGLAAYKNHCAIWFHHGVFLEDADGRLLNAQKTTRGMRQWRIEAGDKIPQRMLKRYVKEAIANERAGKRIVPQRKKAAKLPPELAAEFAANKAAAAAYSALTPGQQREYADHVSSAKRSSTRQSRAARCLPLILAGAGLNDKYRQR